MTTQENSTIWDWREGIKQDLPKFLAEIIEFVGEANLVQIIFEYQLEIRLVVGHWYVHETPGYHDVIMCHNNHHASSSYWATDGVIPTAHEFSDAINDTCIRHGLFFSMLPKLHDDGKMCCHSRGYGWGWISWCGTKVFCKSEFNSGVYGLWSQEKFPSIITR
jgi:hypothetical protein